MQDEGAAKAAGLAAERDDCKALLMATLQVLKMGIWMHVVLVERVLPPKQCSDAPWPHAMDFLLLAWFF
jgi:hypothetical protein